MVGVESIQFIQSNSATSPLGFRSATHAFPGVEADVLTDGGDRVEVAGGYLALRGPWPARTLALAILYLFLIVFRWPVALVVVALGLAEQWVGLRQRFAGLGGNQEEDQ